MPYSSYISCYCYHVDEDAAVYAYDFHVTFEEEDLQGSSFQGTCKEWKISVSANLEFEALCKCCTSEILIDLSM